MMLTNKIRTVHVLGHESDAALHLLCVEVVVEAPAAVPGQPVLHPHPSILLTKEHFQNITVLSLLRQGYGSGSAWIRIHLDQLHCFFTFEQFFLFFKSGKILQNPLLEPISNILNM